MKSTLAERLNEVMEGPPKITGAALAKACGVSQPSVSGWRTGDSKSLDGSNLLAAAEFLGVRPKWLADGVGPKYPDTNSKTNDPVVPPKNGVVDMRRKLALDEILRNLSGYLSQMDAGTRRRSGVLLADLANAPEDHANVAAAMTAMMHSGNQMQAEEGRPKSTSSDTG